MFKATENFEVVWKKGNLSVRLAALCNRLCMVCASVHVYGCHIGWPYLWKYWIESL